MLKISPAVTRGNVCWKRMPLHAQSFWHLKDRSLKLASYFYFVLMPYKAIMELKAVGKQLMAKYKSWRIWWIAYKDALFSLEKHIHQWSRLRP